MLLAQIYEDQCRKPRDFSPMSHSREVLVQQRDPLTFWNEDPENFWAAEKKKREEGPPHLSTFSPLQPINYESEGGLWGKKVVEYEVFSYSEGVVAAHTRQPSNRASLRRLQPCAAGEMTRPSLSNGLSKKPEDRQSLPIVNQTSSTMPLLKNPLFREAVVHEVIRNSPLIQRRQLHPSVKNRR